VNTPCGIIQDLLPLYHDNVCGAESRVLVEEHLKACLSCKATLDTISEELARPVYTADETKLIKSMRVIARRVRTKSFLIGVILTCLLCSVLYIGYLGLIRWNFNPVPVSLLQVSDVSQLADGRIVYHLSVNDNKDISFFRFTTDWSGSRYATPFRNVIEEKQQPDAVSLFNNYYLMDIRDANACYVGPEGNGILIWKSGMKLPAASTELEKLFSTPQNGESIGKG